MTTSTILNRSRIVEDPAVAVEISKNEFTDGEPGYRIFFRYEYLNGYRSIAIKDADVLRSLAAEINALLADS